LIGVTLDQRHRLIGSGLTGSTSCDRRAALSTEGASH
jgi:hypothetical protein